MKKILFPLFILISCLLISCTNEKIEPSQLSGDLKALTEAIKKDSTNSELYFYRSQYYYDHKKIDLSLADILKAVQLNNQQPKYYVLLSDINFAQKETDLAEENLQKAIQMNPKFNEPRIKLAELYYIERMYDDCVKTIDDATKITPHNPTAYLIKAFCYKDLGDTLNYLKMLYLVKDQNPKELKAHLELGYYYQSKNDRQAIEHYQNALQLDPNNQELNYNLAQMYIAVGELEKGKEQYNIVLQISEKGTYAKHALYNLAYIYFVAQKYSETISFCSKAIALDPSFVEAYSLRGEAYEHTNDKVNARKDYEYRLQLHPNYQPAIDGLNSLK